MSKPYIERNYGTLGKAFQLDRDRCALWAQPGMGKTVITATAYAARYALGLLTRPTLILAPFRVAQTTWVNEFHKWDHLKGFDVVPILGTEQERLNALRRDAAFYTVNYENIVWLLDTLGERMPFGGFIIDESTKLKSARSSERVSTLGKQFIRKDGSKRAAAFSKIALKARYLTELTGTPAPNGLIDLWGQLWFIDAGHRLGKTFSAFQSRWFKYNPYTRETTPQPFAKEEIENKLKDVCLTLRAADYFDIKDPIVNNVYVDLPASARKAYEEMEREMYTALAKGELDCNGIETVDEIEVHNGAAKLIKCLQLATGAVYTDDRKNWRETHDVKFQACESIVNEASGMPVIIVYEFRPDLQRLKKVFPKGQYLDKNPETLKAFCKGRIPQLFMHAASGGHGLDGMQDATNMMVFLGQTFNLELYLQVIERIGCVRQIQSGHNRNVHLYHIIARDTVDEVGLARRESKRTVQDLLLEAMRMKQ